MTYRHMNQTEECNRPQCWCNRPVSDEYLTEMVTAYAKCALWSSLNYHTEGEDPTPFDDDYGTGDLAPETLAGFREDCHAFARYNISDLAATDASPAQHGHDFWLTRNGHGAGFWDRGYGPTGDRLSEAARVYGAVDLYAMPDGRIYAQYSPPSRYRDARPELAGLIIQPKVYNWSNAR